MAFQAFKRVLPDRPTRLRILRGPLRGGLVVMNPRNSMRKVLGLYEHELNGWLAQVLLKVNRVIDVGANDGYFTFGCAAAFRRLQKTAEIVAFEPDPDHLSSLKDSVDAQPDNKVTFTLVQKFVGATVEQEATTLDRIEWKNGDSRARSSALIKIDVEGAEEGVLSGASSWINQRNYFLIEVHKDVFLETIPRLFAERGLQLDRVDQRPVRVIGRELRDEANWWLVSRL